MSSFLNLLNMWPNQFLLAHTPFRRTVLTAVLGWGGMVHQPLHF